MATIQKVKQLKDDAILSIKVNKSYYLMVKASLLTMLTEINSDKDSDLTKFMKSLVTKGYNELDSKEKVFYTLTLLVGEIEKQAQDTDAFIEKEIDLEQYIKESKEDAKDSNED